MCSVGIVALFHGGSLCSGISDEELNVLINNSNNALVYKCCHCRISNVGSGGGRQENNSAMKQMLIIIQKLIQEVTELKEHPLQQTSQGDNGAPTRLDNVVHENNVLSSIREINERDKRKNGVILRGFGQLSEGEIRAKFNKICGYLEVGNIELADFCSTGHGLYRANIFNRVEI